MASGFFNIGISGLNAAQAGLLTSSHNIANASTVGFSRQYTVQSTNNPLFTGAGFLGQGTNIQTVQRAYNDFLQKEVRIAETNVSELTAFANQINQIDNLLADPSAGLSPALQGFFKASEEAAANPASIPARQAMLSSAHALVARFGALDQQLSQMRSGVNTQITNEVGVINSLVGQIASINERIIVAQAAASAQPANDLLDQRDTLVSALNKEIKVSIQVETDGSYSVFFGSGQPLVVGGQTYAMVAKPSREDLAQTEIALRAPSGQVMDIPESLITGGTLGGLLRFRSESLDVAQNNLGRVAVAMTSTINAQHRLGRDLDGDVAGDLFHSGSSSVLGAPDNAGTAVVNVNITLSDYRVEYDGTDYNVKRLADDTTTTFSSIPLVVDGIRLEIQTGTPQAGDVFIVRPGELPANRVTKLQSASDVVLTTSGSNLQTLNDSDFRLTMTAPGTFSLTRLSDEVVWTGRGVTADAAIADLNSKFSPQGFWLEIDSGAAMVGDSFLIRPTRNAARDISLAVTDPRDLALAQGFRTAAVVTNGGTGKISAGSVVRTDVPLSAPVALAYEASSNSLTGFPVGSTVIVGSTTYTINSAAQRVPFVAGANYSFGGTGFMLAGAPNDADTFVVNPPPAASAPGGANTGAGTIAAGIVNSASSTPAELVTLNYRQADVGTGLPARLTGFPAGSTVTVRLPNGSTSEYSMNSADGFSDAAAFADFIPFTDGATIEFNGMRFVVSGNPVDGDKFTIGPNTAATGDNRNVLAISALQLANGLGDGTATYQSAYSAMVSLIGNKTRETEVTLTAQENLVKQGNEAMQSVSGVNLDEEAANLMKYQQAYQAAAKMLDLSNKLFDLITGLGR
jgi:flagellar hook-associated protein 1 FlgK